LAPSDPILALHRYLGTSTVQMYEPKGVEKTIGKQYENIVETFPNDTHDNNDDLGM
jgi:hypothetical protein